MDPNYLIGALFAIGLCVLLIWVTKKTIEEYKSGRGTVTQIFEAILLDYVFFTLFFLDLFFPSSSPMWWIISTAICAALILISERTGDWIGGLYQNAIKPYKGFYKVAGIICLLALVLGSYVLAYLTWQKAVRPGFLISALASALIATIGLIIGLFSYANGVWRMFVRDRGELEKKLVTILSFFLAWILIGTILGFIWHLSFINCAFIGIVVLMYFMVPAWVGECQGIALSFLPSAIHIISLLCIGALILPQITV